MQNLRNWYKAAFGLGLALLLTSLFLRQTALAQSSAQAADPTPTVTAPTVDHSQLPALQGPFATPQEVTKVCLSCHTTAAQ